MGRSLAEIDTRVDKKLDNVLDQAPDAPPNQSAGNQLTDRSVDNISKSTIEIGAPKTTTDKAEAFTLNRDVEISSPEFNSLDEYFEYKQRYNNPQEFIDNFVVDNKMNVDFTFDPKYDSTIISSGKARIGEETLIGEKALVRDSELFKTISHEEMHQRLDVKAKEGSKVAKKIIEDLDFEEEYVEKVAKRYLRMKERQLGKLKH